jgi:hypothetical protein
MYPPQGWAVGGNTRSVCAIERSAHQLGHSDRPGVTEPPELTSDPICTADRRGGILISFGPTRTTMRVLNPSSSSTTGPWPGRIIPACRPVDRAAETGRPRLRCIPLKRGDCLKPVEETPVRHAVARHADTRRPAAAGTASAAGKGGQNAYPCPAVQLTGCVQCDAIPASHPTDAPDAAALTRRSLARATQRRRCCTGTRAEGNVAWPEVGRSSRAACVRSGRMRATQANRGVVVTSAGRLRVWSCAGSVQISVTHSKKALGALASRASLRSSVALLPVVLASSGFAESTSPFQSARTWTDAPGEIPC